MKWLLAYFVCLACFLLLDGAFIGLVAKKVYYKELGELLNTKPKILPAGLFYLLYLGAVLLYGVWPLLTLLHHDGLGNAWLKVAAWGAGLGVLAYATYSLTAKSLVKNWSTKVAVVDILWGGVLTAALTTVGYAILV